MCIKLPKIDKELVGYRINILRSQSNMSMEELAKKIHVGGKSTINNWEKGIAKPKQSNLKSLSNIFDVPVEYILYGDKSEFIRNLLNDNFDKISNSISYYLDSEGYYLNEDGVDVVSDTITNEEAYKVINENIHNIMTYVVKKNLGYFDYKKIIEISAKIIENNAFNMENILSRISYIKKILTVDNDNLNSLQISKLSKLSLEEFINKIKSNSSTKSKISSYYAIKLDNLILNDFYEEIDKLKSEYLSSVNDYKTMIDEDLQKKL